MTRPVARICITGSELTRGETKDINGPFLGTGLTTLGVDVEGIEVVPDDPSRLARAFRDCMERADIVLVSGGLGPTADDHTIGVLAGVLGRGIVRDPQAQRRMHERILERVHSEDRIPSNFFKQAEVIEGSTVFLNPVGLAPGCLIETPRGFLVVLPGVPRELRALFREAVLPEIRTRFDLDEPRVFRAKILGVGESWAESRIQAIGIDFEALEYGISARPGELLVKLLAHKQVHHAAIDTARGLLEAEFGDALLLLPEGLLDAEGDPLQTDQAHLVHQLLVDSGRTVATAESCTGGLVARHLTEHPGSSAYFLGSVVAYQDLVKERILGIDSELIARYGAVSPEVCHAMTLAATTLFHAHHGVGITGVAGPGGGSEEKPVGLVYIGLASQRGGDAPDVTVTKNRFWGNRFAVRQQSAVKALELLRRELLAER